MPFTILTVAEDGNHSDRLSGVQDFSRDYHPQKLYISVDADGNMTIKKYAGTLTVLPQVTIDCPKTDIDGLISYFQEVKQFMEEEAMVNRLMGRA
jgi:hypothetical protein